MSWYLMKHDKNSLQTHKKLAFRKFDSNLDDGNSKFAAVSEILFFFWLFGELHPKRGKNDMQKHLFIHSQWLKVASQNIAMEQ